MHMTLRSKRANQLMDSAASSSSQPSNAHINDLPYEMLLKVFSYLDQDTLLNTIPKVCRRWETQHSDPSLYREFIFTEHGPSTEEVLKLLSMAKWLKILKLESRTDTDAILECVRISNQRLETLNLRNCEGSSSRWAISSDSLLGVLDECNLLQHLSLDGSYCQDREVYNEIGLRLPSLRSVDLGEPRRFDSQALVNIADNCLNLEEIRVRDIHMGGIHSITDHIVSYLCNKSKFLKIIGINFHRCTDASMMSLATCQHLTTLTLQWAYNVTDIGIMAISDMPQLVKLSVRGNELITTQGWSAFLQRPIMRRLQELRLLCCENLNQQVMNMILNNPYDLRELFLVNLEMNCIRSFNPGNH